MMKTEQEKLAEIYFNTFKTNDFKTFAGFCKVYSDFSNTFIFLRYENWTYAQKQFQKDRCGKDIVLKPRRIGFTTLELARDLFFALSNPGSSVVIVAQEFNLAKKALQEIKNMIENLNDTGKALGNYQFIPNIKSSNLREIVFETNSKIICEVAKNQENAADRTGRGIGITRLHCTEVAFWSYPDLTMKSLLIAAKTAKEIVIESTPNGSSGYFFETYYKAKEGKMTNWKAHFFPWFLHKDYQSDFMNPSEIKSYDMKPRNEYEEKLINSHKINAKQLKWWREAIEEASNGIDSMLQEFPIDEASCFRVKSQTFLDQSDFEWLESSYRDPIDFTTPRFGQEKIRIFEHASSTGQYIIGADSSYGREQDFSTFTVLNRSNGSICATYANNKIPPNEFAQILVDVAQQYSNALLVVEVQGPGIAVIEQIKQTNYLNLFKHADRDYYGFNTSGNKRIEMLNLFQKMIKERDPIIADVEIVRECRTMIFDNSNKITHANGAHDDRLFSYMLAQKVRCDVPVSVFVGYTSVKSSRLSDNYSTGNIVANNRIGRMRNYSLR